MTCRQRDKAKQLLCHGRNLHRSFKHRVIGFSRFSGRKHAEHPYGWGLVMLGLLGFMFIAGGALLATTITVNNPTAATVSLNTSTLWTNSSGGVVNSGAKVGGVLNFAITIPQVAIVEWSSAAVTYYIGTAKSSFTYTGAVPYYVVAVYVQLYQGSQLIQSVPGVWTANVPSTISMGISTWVNGWASNFFSTMIAASSLSSMGSVSPPSATVPGGLWTGSLSTYGLQNGVTYTLFTEIVWSTAVIATTGTAGSVTVGLQINPVNPPSLTSLNPSTYWTGSASSGYAIWLSTLTLGPYVPPLPLPVIVGLLLLAAFAVVIVVYQRETGHMPRLRRR